MSSLPDVSLGGTHDPGPAVAVDDTESSPYVRVEPDAPAPPPVQGSTEVDKLPDTELEGEQLTWWEQAWAALCHWFRQASESAQARATHPGGINAMQPESPAAYWAYVKARPWVPEGCTGRLLTRVPNAYYYTLGAAGMYVGYGVSWLFRRMLHFNIALLVGVITLSFLFIFG